MFKCREGPEYLSNYREVRQRTVRDHFDTTRFGFSGYSRARGIKKRSIPNWFQPVEGYEDLVKQINGDNLVEVINDAVRDHAVVRLLDVCTGRARFLRESIQIPEWSGKLQPSGIDIIDWTKFNDPTDPFSKPIEEELKGIEIKTGDVQDLAEHYQGRSFRFIMAMNALIYFADPLSPLQDIHNLLEPGGKAYIYSCPIPVEDDKERQWFIEYLIDNGIDCGRLDPGTRFGVNIAIHRKNPDPIKFPLQYNGWNYSGWEMGERFLYKLDK